MLLKFDYYHYISFKCINIYVFRRTDGWQLPKAFSTVKTDKSIELNYAKYL